MNGRKQMDGLERTGLRERIEVQLRGRSLHAREAPDEEIEEEVRERLYGWHSGCVELCDGEDPA